MFGVVADDSTGAHDIGAMFNRAGVTVHVLMEWNDGNSVPDADVVVLDTNSRCDSPALAYQKVRGAVELLRRWGCTRFYKKICSVFRGNVGVEFDAVLDALGERFLPVVAAFPENGRTTRDGIHYVRGVPLAESEFKDDPTHPMTESNLVKILQDQTDRPVAHVPWQTVRDGLESCRRGLEKARAEGAYVILDASDSGDLVTIAEGLDRAVAIAGSSALGEYVGRTVPARAPKPDPQELFHGERRGVLVVAGSVTPQTQAQVVEAGAAGIALYPLESVRLVRGHGRRQLLQEAVDRISLSIRDGEDVVLYATHSKEDVAESVAAGRERGQSGVEVGRMIAEALAGVTLGVASAGELRGLVVCGGETAGSVSRALGITGSAILREIEPGIPSGLSFGRRELLTVMKPGGYGSPGFLLEAIAHIRSLTASGV